MTCWGHHSEHNRRRRPPTPALIERPMSRTIININNSRHSTTTVSMYAIVVVFNIYVHIVHYVCFVSLKLFFYNYFTQHISKMLMMFFKYIIENIWCECICYRQARPHTFWNTLLPQLHIYVELDSDSTQSFNECVSLCFHSRRSSSTSERGQVSGWLTLFGFNAHNLLILT